jgi:hypothetical protein
MSEPPGPAQSWSITILRLLCAEAGREAAKKNMKIRNSERERTANMPFLLLLENVFSFRMSKLQRFLFATLLLLKKWDIGGAEEGYFL